MNLHLLSEIESFINTSALMLVRSSVKCLLRPNTFRRYASINAHMSKKSIDKNNLHEKYRSKLESKAKMIGLNNAEELKEQLKDKLEAIKKDMNRVDPLKELEDYEKALRLKESLKGIKKKGLDPIDPNSPTAPFKTLDSFIKVEKLEALSSQEIEFLWRARFQSDETALVAAVPAETFQRMYRLARANPTFVLPLPKTDAQVEGEPTGDNSTPMEIHFVQWTFVGPHTTHCMITSLMEYKLHKEYARPHTTLSFHQELQSNKKLVLMKGHVEKEAPITLAESQLLLLNLQRFYGAMGTESNISQQRIKLLEAFNSGSTDFSMDKCIELSQSLEN